MPARPEPTPSTFGDSMEQLEAIVAQLEANEDLALEQALELYERGLKLSRDCQQRLASARLKLTELAVPAVAPVPEET